MKALTRGAIKRAPEIKEDWCKGCGICVSFCPQGAIFLNNDNKAKLSPAQCNGCGICEMYCPDFAITMKEEGTVDDRG